MPSPRRCLLAAAAIALLACDKQPQAPHGAPVLLQVVWEVAGVPTLVWSRDADAAVAPLAMPAASKIDFVFDRRLDGARVEDTVNDRPVPKADPPITVAWPDMETVMSDPPFAAGVFYNSLPDWGPATTSAFVQPAIAGFPSGTPVTFTLDSTGLTSVYGEPMDGPGTITVMTAPLAVTVPTSSAIVSTAYRAPIVFSTRAAAKDALLPFVRVTAGGAAQAFDLARDGSDSKRVLVIPVGCMGAWPPGTRVDISVDPGAPDGFGRPAVAVATGSFTTAPIVVDGGCGLADAGDNDGGVADGGGNDGGVADAPPDDGASDDASDDAQPSN